MVKCVDCGKQIPEDHDLCCDMCGAPLCKECGATGLCSTCAELWGSEIDLEDMEAEEEEEQKRSLTRQSTTRNSPKDKTHKTLI